ncbi:hypothetical protein RGUI_0685 [Rhodovulum sp. P5]|uniref:DUF1127 domain-containing protein n=1 Tax=Rhodovulum sp. P5 TaxID=1564506 RepID=UPI0009C2C0AF|nr:DUF1127 domain-containing protein [Rhodovulum sp. P5]ARE38826.1 hypothetical protein RGUI_0685 [Rhodovulum sp. P5]
MTHISTVPHLRSGVSPVQLVRRIALGLRAAEQRRRLATLDPALLRDIGLTPEDALAEARRPVWDVPSSWLR